MGSNKSKKELYLYIPRKKDNLPEEGWLQPCYNCAKIVSKTIFLCKLYEKKKKYKCFVYMCNVCKRRYNKNLIINRKKLINDLIRIKKLNPIKFDYKPVEP